MWSKRPYDSSSERRIVVTGVGVVSPGGREVGRFWESLTRPGDGAQSPTAADETPGSGVADFSGRIDDFDGLSAAARKSIRKALKLMNRETQMGVAAGQQALHDSRLIGGYDPERIGVCFGADNVSIMPEDFLDGVQACRSAEGDFDADRWGTDGIGEVAPLWLLKCLPNMPACHLAIFNDLRGPNNTNTQRDVAANMAIAEACRAIKGEHVDAMLVGATGTTLSTFNLMRARLEDEVSAGDEEAVCRPFDKRRSGAVPGEGAGAVVLEELDSAVARGATIYGEVLAAASSSSIGRDRSAACGRALASAMRQALRRARLSPDNVGHVHAHGLGTQALDAAEAGAIGEVFGTRSQQTPVVAAKSRLANAGAGAGALELIASLLALKEGRLFPVHNYRDPDPDCPIRPVTGRDEPAGDSFLNLNLFSRGLASCVAVGLCEE